MLYLDTLVLENRLVSKPLDRLQELGNYWAATFAHRDIDAPKAHRFLKKHAVDFCLEHIPDTSPQSIDFHMRHTHNSKTGPNGIPDLAYKTVGPLADSILSVTS